MKRLIAMALALVLVLGMVAMVANAETVKESYEAPVEEIITIGEDAQADVEMQTVLGEGELVEGEMEVVTVYGGEELVEGEMEIVTVYGEEESGFLGWLKNLWKSILNLFGL